MNQNKSYFNRFAHHHAYHRDPDFYLAISSCIRQIQGDKKNMVLDLGCGDGSFIKDMIASGIDGNFLGIDVSDAMIGLARESLNNPEAEFLTSDGFNLPLRPDLKFDIIHIDSVLHHLVDNTRTKSKNLADRLVQILLDRLAKDGVLIIEEFYYASHIMPHITSSIIFYGLKIMNLLNVDLGKVISEFKPGLEVNFLSIAEIEGLLLKHHLSPRVIRRIENKVPRLYRFFLLKNYGYISFAASQSSVA